MRGPSLLLVIAFLSAVSPAWAQTAENTRTACTDGLDNDADGHLDCADQDCQDFTFCAAVAPQPTRGSSEVAQLRGKGTTRVVVGAVLLSLGIVIAAASAGPWVIGASEGHSIDRSPPYQGAIAMDVVGVLLAGAGTAVLAVGAGNLAEARRPKYAVGPASFAVTF